MCFGYFFFFQASRTLFDRTEAAINQIFPSAVNNDASSKFEKVSTIQGTIQGNISSTGSMV
jgi:hypothetical protein